MAEGDWKECESQGNRKSASNDRKATHHASTVWLPEQDLEFTTPIDMGTWKGGIPWATTPK